MVKSKAIKVLSRLNKEEFHKLEKFLSSPYFNANKNLLKLIKLLKKFHPSFASPKFTKQNVFNHVYENEEYNDEKLRKLFSDLYKELEKFLVILQLENNKTIYNKLFLEIFDNKKLDNLFLSKYVEANKYLDEKEFEYSYYFEKFLLEWQYITFHLDRGKQLKIAGNILERGDYAALFYLCDLFLTLNDITVNKMAYGFEKERNLSEKFLDYFDAESFFNHIDEGKFFQKEIIKLFYYTYQANKNFDEENYYDKLEKFVFENLEKFSRIVKVSSIIYLQNYCLIKIFRGDNKFKNNLNNAYKVFLEQKLFLRENQSYIRTDVFLKILDNFHDVGKIEELKDQLEKNIDFCYPEHKESILCYYNALINFSKREYNNALMELIQIKTSSPFFDTKTKRLTLKILYEQRQFEEAEALLENFKRFLSRCKSLSEQRREQLIEFTNAYNELLKVNVKADDFSLAKLKKQLSGNLLFTDRDWVHEKIRELESKERTISSYLKNTLATS